MRYIEDMSRDELDRATLAAQDPDAVSGLHPDTLRHYSNEPAADWRTRHRYISDAYEDDPGAPGPDAYTAKEKRSRAMVAVWCWRIAYLAGLATLMWLAAWLPSALASLFR